MEMNEMLASLSRNEIQAAFVFSKWTVPLRLFVYAMIMNFFSDRISRSKCQTERMNVEKKIRYAQFSLLHEQELAHVQEQQHKPTQ
jgi:hypothetical protein